MKDKQECYEEATRKCLGNPSGTRMDIIYLAMDIYAMSLLHDYEMANVNYRGNLVEYVSNNACLPYTYDEFWAIKETFDGQRVKDPNFSRQ